MKKRRFHKQQLATKALLKAIAPFAMLPNPFDLDDDTIILCLDQGAKAVTAGDLRDLQTVYRTVKEGVNGKQKAKS